ncbi:L,D-transpeptidase [Conexibacter sp. W3-3-2]|uniref:L,D-transpeptidase n=1 Tax=Conexibacter sp. W3-3-2 TaxID=2675227 RepID=UPI0035C90DF7
MGGRVGWLGRRGRFAAEPAAGPLDGPRRGIGIHGTSEEGSIGSRASHGCVRMRVRDVVRLYRRVRVGTPVVIG